MKKILYVHGFGVMKDARGMFTDLAKGLSDKGFQSVLFDMNDTDVDGTIHVNDFSEQVRRLRMVWEKESQDSKVYIIAHSQGCIITALANLPNISKTILLAPPTDSKSEKTINYFKSKPGTEININGVSKLVRSDGSFTTVPAAYWAEKDKVDAQALFKKYTEQHQTAVIRATDDEVISNEGMSSAFLGIEIRDVKTNHNFEGEGRVELLKEVRQILED